MITQRLEESRKITSSYIAKEHIVSATLEMI